MNAVQQQIVVNTWNTFIISAFPNNSPWQLNRRRIQNNGHEFALVMDSSEYNAQGTMPGGENVVFAVYVRQHADLTFHLAMRSPHGTLNGYCGTPADVADRINDLFGGLLVWECQRG
jgi:hypothetical protein